MFVNQAKYDHSFNVSDQELDYSSVSTFIASQLGKIDLFFNKINDNMEVTFDDEEIEK